MTRVKFSIPKATNPGASTSKSAIKASQHNSKRRVARQGSAKFEEKLLRRSIMEVYSRGGMALILRCIANAERS